MLSDEVIEKVSKRLVERMQKGNEYILNKIGKSVKKIGTLNETSIHELEQILKYGGDYEKIVKKLAEITNLNVKDIYKIFEEVAKSDYRFAKQFYDYRNIKYIPYEENLALQEQVRAIASITANQYRKLVSSSVLGYGFTDDKGKFVFKGLRKAYNDIIDEAILNVSQGKETFQEAMYRTLNELGNSGLRVKYESGATRRLDSAINTNLQDGIRQLHNETQQIFGKEFNSDGVEISVHLNPAPDHMYVQGKQFSNEEFQKFQSDQDAVSYDGIKFPAESEETGHDRRSIGQYNCYHNTFSIVLGVSKQDYSNEQLQEIIDKNNKGFDFEGKHYTMYEGTQLQRKIELELRKAKDNQILGRTTGNEKQILKSQERITMLTNKYHKLNKASELPSAIERARVSGYKRISKKKLQ